MPKQTRSNLSGRADTIAGETLIATNSAARVGSLFADIIASATLDYDPARTYAPGESVTWQGVDYTAFETATPGQSPATHPAKWIDYLARTTAQVGENLPDYPATQRLLKTYVAEQLLANPPGENGGEIPEKATPETANDKTNNTQYITPYVLGLLLDAIASGQDLPEIDFSEAQPGYVAVIKQRVDESNYIGFSPGSIATGSGATKLSQLTEYIASEAIKLRSGGNYLLEQRPTDALGRRGLLYALLDALGNASVKAGFSVESNGATGFFQDAAELRLLNQALTTNARTFDAGSTDTLVKSISLSELSVATKPITGVPTWQINDATGEYENKQATGAQLFALQLPQLAQYIASLGLTPESQPRPVVAIKCYTANVAAQDVQYLTVAPADYGQPLDHNLQTTAGNIWVEIQLNGTPATDLATVSLTGNSTLSLSPIDTDITDATFSVKLTRTNPIS